MRDRSRLLDLEDLDPRARLALIVGGTFLATILVAFVIAQILVGSPERSSSAAVRRLEPAAPREVLADSGAAPKKLAEPIGFAGRRAGLALLGVGEVDRVETADGDKRAAEGSRLIAFQVGDWPCAQPPCESWATLKLTLLVDGTEKDLPETDGDRFVVVVPPGTDDLVLSARTDGVTQTLSLLDAEPGSRNIAFLGDREREHRSVLNKTIAVTEQTSIALDDGTGQTRDVFQRDVTVADLDRTYFLGEETPASTRSVFLTVRVTFGYAGQTQRYLMPDTDVAFEAPDGQRYAARPIDLGDQNARLIFEIPARTKKGDLVFAGVTDKTSTTGTPYTSTLVETRLPVELP